MARGLEGGVRTATEHDAGDATGHRPPRDRRVPGEQAERAAIVRQHVGAELIDAALLSRMKDLLEEESSRGRARARRPPRRDRCRLSLRRKGRTAPLRPTRAPVRRRLRRRPPSAGDSRRWRRREAPREGAAEQRRIAGTPSAGSGDGTAPSDEARRRGGSRGRARRRRCAVSRPVRGRPGIAGSRQPCRCCFRLARSRCSAARPWAPHRRPGRRPRPP